MNEVGGRGHSAALLAMVIRALESVNAGVDPRQQICIDLDALLGSDSSAYVIRGRAGELQLSSSGEPLDRDLVERLLPLLTSGAHPFCFTTPHCDQGVCLPLTVSRARTAALVLSGGRPDNDLLEQAGRALREVDALVAGLPDPVPDLSGECFEPALTPRELEVLRLLEDGLLARTIAARLDLSPRTVHHYLGSIYDKLGVRDRLAAVLRAREVGLLSDRSRTVPDSPRQLAAASGGPWS